MHDRLFEVYQSIYQFSREGGVEWVGSMDKYIKVQFSNYNSENIIYIIFFIFNPEAHLKD